MRIEQAPYLIGIHYMAHKTNLVVQSLSTMPMVSKLENLLQALYGFFLPPQNTILNSLSLLKL
jgi:hypothetical protein